MLEKITFPEHEYESVQNWLNLQGYCYTTRVYKEVGKYKVGESYLAPWGEILRIDEIQTYWKVSDRPFYDEMSDAEKEEICKYSEDIGLPYEFIRFSRISKNSNKMNITIKNYVMVRIQEIKLHKLTPTITFDDVFKKCRIENASGDTKMNARNAVIKFMQHMKNKLEIIDFEVTKRQNSFYSVRFTYAPRKPQVYGFIKDSENDNH